MSPVYLAWPESKHLKSHANNQETTQAATVCSTPCDEQPSSSNQAQRLPCNRHGYQTTLYREACTANNPSDSFTDLSVDLIEEMPLVITVNGLAHAVMMITPINIESFIMGFAYSEGIISSLQDIRDLRVDPIIYDGIHSITADIVLSPRALHTYKQQQTARKGSTGCGLCGTASLADALPPLKPLPDNSAFANLNAEQLIHLRDNVSTYQVLGRQVGAIHAAVLIDEHGTVLTSHEDIGRHNALDKIIGWALEHQKELTGTSVLMTSRCSTELIQKAVRAGIHSLIHLASPSALAVQQARRYGLSLIHIPRHGKPRYFSDRYTSTKCTDNHPSIVS